MATALSDFNSKGNFGDYKVAAQVSKDKKNLYSDLNLFFQKNPNTLDISPLRDIDAVRQSVKNLVLTNFFERPFHPELGSNVTALLFEPADQFTGIAIRDEIQRVVEEFEPRVNNVVVQVFADIDANRYQVSVFFNVVFTNVEQEVTFNLQRLR